MAKKAAGLMGMIALRADNEHVRALMSKLPKGKLFDSGKAFVPFVKQDLFNQLAAHLPEDDRAIADRPRATSSVEQASEGGAGDQQRSPAKVFQQPEDWSKLAVGNLVLATEAPFDGWYEATIMEIKSNGELRLKWRDYLELPSFGRTVEQVALIHPKYVEG